MYNNCCVVSLVSFKLVSQSPFALFVSLDSFVPLLVRNWKKVVNLIQATIPWRRVDASCIARTIDQQVLRKGTATELAEAISCQVIYYLPNNLSPG